MIDLHCTFGNMQISCPICDQKKFSDRNLLNKGKLTTCQTCNLVLYLPRPTNEEMEQYYTSNQYKENYAKSPMAGEAFARQRYNQFIQIVSKKYPNVLASIQNKKLLDIGCGDGDFLKIAASEGWDISGTEVSDRDIIYDEQKIPLFVGNISELDLPENTYDIITCYHVIEHLVDPMLMINAAKKSLKKGGLLFVETPNIGSIGSLFKREKWSQIMPPEHLSYFSPKSLKYCLEKGGFFSTKTTTITPSIIQSLSQSRKFNKQLFFFLYKVFPLLNLGATLQGFGIK